MVQTEFANKVKTILENDPAIVGIAGGGSFISGQLDEFSDLDLVIVTKDKITGNKELMLEYAKKLGNFLSGFTGEHVGEPRLLICLYDNPLLHVDLKFVTLDEFTHRLEDPVLILDKEGKLQQAIARSPAVYPFPGHQWIEDRFWTWIHYALLKIGRGEYLEAFDFSGFLRMVVLGPLLHTKNGNLPRGVRKVEKEFSKNDLELIVQTIPAYDKTSLLTSLRNSVALYRQLRTTVFDKSVKLQTETERRVLKYFEEVENQVSNFTGR